MKRSTAWLAATVLLTLSMLTSACSGDTETPTPTATSSDPLERGRIGYLTAGCAVCHGADGLGTSSAPALAGHTAQQILRQVREPLGTMPNFDETQISDAELSDIVSYVTSFDGGHEHRESVDLPPDELTTMHLLLALDAIDAGNAAEAVHHLDHLLEAIEGAQADRVRLALDAVSSGDLHEAEHELEELAGDEGPLGLGPLGMHLRLALVSLEESRDVADVRHHLLHAEELVATDAQHNQVHEALDLLAAGDVHDVEHVLESILEGEDVNGDGGDHSHD